MIKTVVFDLDGTLVQIPINYDAMYSEFKRIMKTDNVRPVTEKVANLDETTKAQVFEAWDRAEHAVQEKISANEEGIRIYRKFCPKPKALVTMQGKPLVKYVLERRELCFEVVVTREDSLSRAEQLKIAAEKLKTPFQNLLFVGNADNDELSARKVGCHFLRVK